MIDMASVYAERFKSNPNALRAAVMGQSPDPKLDPYTALNALRLVKESEMAAMAGQAQQPTSAPSILAQTMAPPTPPQGLAGMMPMGAPAGQMPQRAPQAPQAPVMQASGGLAGLPTPEHDYADGGIVAFARGGSNSADSSDADENAVIEANQRDAYGMDKEAWPTATGDEGEAPSSVQARATAAQQAYADYEPEEMSTKDVDALYRKYLARMQEAGGPDIYAPAQERLAAREKARAGDRSQGTGLALLTAAGKILKGHNLAMGASEALPAFAQQMGEVQKADQQEQRAIEQMNFALADAQRKERMGDARGAQAAVESARKFQQDANKAKGDKLRYSADIATRNVQYSRLANKGAGSGLKLPEQLGAAEIEYSKNPTAENKAMVDALSRAVAKSKTSFATSEIAPTKANTALAPVQARIDAKVADSMKNFPIMNRAYAAAERKGDTNEMKRLWKAEEDKWRGIHSKAEAAAAGNRAAGTAEEPIKRD